MRGETRFFGEELQSKVVIVACMHKLLVIMNAVVRSGHAFSRTYTQDMKHENIAKVA